MLRVGGRPVIDFLIERMLIAGVEAVVVVTRPDKRDVVEHVTAAGADVALGTPRTVSESLLLGLERVRDADVALLGFPDTIWDPEDGFVRLVGALDEDDVALGVFGSDEPERSDVAVLDGDRVLEVHVKPPNPPGRLVWGCAAARVSALHALDRYADPGYLFDKLARSGRVRAVRFPGRMIDVGTPEALAQARRLLGS